MNTTPPATPAGASAARNGVTPSPVPTYHDSPLASSTPRAASRPPVSVPFPIFLVEDSDDDLFLFRRLLGKAEITNPLRVATNGQAAIDQLSELVAKPEPGTLPGIVFLDLKLPLRSGFEVLEWIRAQPALARTAVIVLSSSAEARDVKRAYDLGAHGYLVKYPGPAVFRDVLRTLTLLPPDAPLDGVTFEGMTRP